MQRPNSHARGTLRVHLLGITLRRVPVRRVYLLGITVRRVPVRRVTLRRVTLRRVTLRRVTPRRITLRRVAPRRVVRLQALLVDLHVVVCTAALRISLLRVVSLRSAVHLCNHMPNGSGLRLAIGSTTCHTEYVSLLRMAVGSQSNTIMATNLAAREDGSLRVVAVQADLVAIGQRTRVGP